MNDEERLLRDLWMAEMWPTVYQYVAPVDPRPVDRDTHKSTGRNGQRSRANDAA